MNIRHYLLAGIAAVGFSASAHAQSFSYGVNMVTNSSLGPLQGSASATSTTIKLNNNAANSFGAVSSANTFATAGTDFSTTFDFQDNTSADCVSGTPAGCSKGNGNGFAFVLTTAPSSNGVSNGSLGIGTGAGTSLDVVFGTYGATPVSPSSSYNYVGVTTDGKNNFNTSGLAHGNLFGAANSACSSTAANSSVHGVAGCMANGDVWTVSITLINNLMTVALADKTTGGSITNPFSSFTFNLGSYFGGQAVNIGFTASTGATVYQQVSITNWSATDSLSSQVPEPASLAALGAGLIGLGMVRRQTGRKSV